MFWKYCLRIISRVMKIWLPVLLLLLNISISFSQEEYLDFTVQTHSYNGEYKPENCGVIWVETADGRFVRTLKVWADKRINRLVKWQETSFGNVTDAVTSATIKTHEFHSVRWDMKDFNRNSVQNGDYNIMVECTEDDSNKPAKPKGKYTIVPFTKTGYTYNVEIKNEEFFSDITISYNAQPNSVKSNQNIVVGAFPNPFTEQVNIQILTTGLNDVRLTLVNSLGEEIERKSALQQNSQLYQFDLQLPNLASGIYYCHVTVGKYSAIYKVVKL